jgi:hypothetical protein
MRLIVAALALIIIVGVAAFGAIFSQKATDPVAAATPNPPAEPVRAVTTVIDESDAVSAPLPSAPSAASPCPGNPNALGVSRVVEIDTTGGPQFGFEHFKTHDFLRPGEVVLTFDDGPWPKNTPAVLAALAAHCTKAIFFPIGLHATYEPGILKQVAAAGHAVGSHTWCHQDLSRTKGRCLMNGKVQAVEYDPKDEIEKGISAVRMSVEQVRQSVMARLNKLGKAIILMHDFQHATAEAAADLLNDLKAGGYKVVFMKPKFPVTTIASYDEAVLKASKLPSDGRPTSSVVRTISE